MEVFNRYLIHNHLVLHDILEEERSQINGGPPEPVSDDRFNTDRTRNNNLNGKHEVPMTTTVDVYEPATTDVCAAVAHVTHAGTHAGTYHPPKNAYTNDHLYDM